MTGAPPAGKLDEPQHRVTIAVRWQDGYLERFAVDEWRASADLLWMRLATGGNRHIPLGPVRWWSSSEESHEHSPAG